MSLLDQKEAPSSREKSTPPMGAPKAEATPEAAPHETKSLCQRRKGVGKCWGERSGSLHSQLHSQLLLFFSFASHLLPIVPKVLEAGEGGVHPPERGAALRDARRHHRANVHHGALFPRGQPRGDGENDADHLAEHGLDAHDPDGVWRRQKEGWVINWLAARLHACLETQREAHLGRLTPFRNALISGMPDPAATGSISTVRFATKAYRQLRNQYTKKEAPGRRVPATSALRSPGIVLASAVCLVLVRSGTVS